MLLYVPRCRAFIPAPCRGKLCVVPTVYLFGLPSQSKGLAIVADPEKDKSMVELLLQLKDAVDHIVEHGFQKNDAVVYIGKQAFEKIVNSRENRPAELIGALWPS